MKVYVASPFGFSEAGRDFYYNVLIPRIEQQDLQVIDPWKLTAESKIRSALDLPYGEQKRNQWRILNEEIGNNNCAAIDSTDILFAVLDGVDVDSGTAAEIGYAYAKKKRILGYRGDFRLSADNEGSTVNLQVEFFIKSSGGEIITSLDQLEDAISRLKI